MFLAMTEETILVITVAITAGMLLLTIFLFLGIRRDRRKFKEEKSLIIDGLLSRTAINSEINSYLSKVGKEDAFSLIRIEIDNYAEAVKAFGHAEAKRALERVAYFMAKAIPRRCSMGNFQTTHFLVLMKAEYERMESYRTAKKLLAIITKPIKIFKNTYINFECSIGICYYPLHGTRFKELMKSLTIAVNDARSKGINEIGVYGEGMAAAEDGLSLQMALKQAMEEKQFVLFYQPIIDITKDKFYGVEALVRWKHPSGGLIAPQSFLDAMEQSGDINWIGTWGMETLIQEYYEIRREFPYLTYQINFNLSVKQLLSEAIVGEFMRLIKKYKMNPQTIVLELAGFSAYQKYTIIKQNLAKLKKIGFKISLNAYGIDSNTLLTLDEMPIDVIKLDRLFFKQEEAEDSYLKERLMEMIVEWGEKNNKDVIAEGIENEDMLNFCKNFNINLIQGYYFSEPVSSAEIINYIRERAWEKEEIEDDFDDFLLNNGDRIEEEAELITENEEIP
jgi:diguanylate cyclase (GGDEF)-like protein